MHVHVHVPCTCICIAHARTVGEQVDNERTARRSRAVGPRSVYGEGVVEGRVPRLEQHLHMPCMCMHHAYTALSSTCTVWAVPLYAVHMLDAVHMRCTWSVLSTHRLPTLALTRPDQAEHAPSPGAARTTAPSPRQ